MDCKTFLIVNILMKGPVLLNVAAGTVGKVTNDVAAASHDCGIFLFNDQPTTSKWSIEVLKIINSSALSDVETPQPLRMAANSLDSSTNSDVGVISQYFYPTSIIDVVSPKTQPYFLDTGKTVGYFSHSMRGRLKSQLVVLADSPTMLISSVLKRGAGIFVQTERSYWNTFSRIVLHFTEEFDEDSA